MHQPLLAPHLYWLTACTSSILLREPTSSFTVQPTRRWSIIRASGSLVSMYSASNEPSPVARAFSNSRLQGGACVQEV